MNWRTVGTVVVCTIAVALLTEPIAKRVFIGELDRAMGIRLSADSFHCSPLRSDVTLTNVILTTDEPPSSAAQTGDERTLVTADYLWAKADTKALFHRRLSSPIAVARGVKYQLKTKYIARLPSIPRHAAMSIDGSPDPGEIVDPMFQKLDQIFSTANQAIDNRNQEIAGVEQQLNDIERALRATDNPLRSRQEARELQKELAVLKKILSDAESGISGIIKPYDDQLSQIRAEWLNRTQLDKSIIPDLDVNSSRSIAQQLIANLAAEYFEAWHPQLGMSQQFISLMQMQPKALPGRVESERDYGFDERFRSRCEISRFIVSGEVESIGKSFPFRGTLTKIGNTSSEAVSPTVQLVFEDRSKPSGSARRSVIAKVVPETDGFMLRAQVENPQRESWRVDANRFHFDCQLDDSTSSVVWYLQNSEWTADLIVSAVVTQMSASLNKGPQSILKMLEKSTNEPIYQSNEKEVLLHCQLQGNIDDGKLIQVDQKIESPAIDALATSLMALSKKSAEETKASMQDIVLRKIDEHSQQHKSFLVSIQSEASQRIANNDKRMSACSEVVTASLNPSTNLRVAKPATSSLNR